MHTLGGSLRAHQAAITQHGARTLLKVILLVLVVGIGLTLAALFFQSRPTKISGRVVSANTGTPLSEAIVVVQSGMFDGPGSPEPIYAQTDKDGRFVAKLYDNNIS